MKSWSYGVNSLYKTANIFLDEAPFYIFFLDWLVESLCELIPAIPLPRIKIRLRNPGEIEDNDGKEWTTLDEWYGDLSQAFHLFVHMPVFDFCGARTDSRAISVGYKKLRKIFRERDKEYWDNIEKEEN
ncbi:hypothetical protein ES703_40126 [subsurface metagenome]